MDKMNMETANKTLENLAKLKEMFPEVITETKDANGDIVSAIDAKKLEQLLSTKVIEGDESYDFTWVGKKQAMVEANRPIRKTLRPCKEESVDWENTENIYIEGDNLDVLKLLQESYLNKIKMIYIDPPYNTGNDSFIYPDDYKTNKDQYDEEVGAIDESGYRMFKNTETNGRFHSSWCSMMYPRLKLARNLLSEDGVIFISIDDNEVDNMRKMCDEIFGEGNFIAQLIWNNSTGGGLRKKHFNKCHEYIICFAKDIEYLPMLFAPMSLAGQEAYSKEDEYGKYREQQFAWQNSSNNPNQRYPIVMPDGCQIIPGNGYIYRFIESSFKNLLQEHRIVFKKTKKSIYKTIDGKETEWSISVKDYLGDAMTAPITLLPKEYVKMNIESVNEMMCIFGKKIFEYSKPATLIAYLINIISKQENSIILDFFSGSATTAHAVMQLNAEDGGKRKFIMVQLPEVCDEKSEASKAGYTNICEIGKERIRRAGKKIKEETGKTDLDIGFRVLKLDESNMKDVYFTPEEYKQTDLVDMVSNIKEDRTPEDLLYACMLEWGLELSLPHKVENIAGYNVHIVNDGDLIACFDNRISEEAIKQIADKKPLRAVFRDSSFASDASRVNVGEIFKLKSPNTTIKVI